MKRSSLARVAGSLAPLAVSVVVVAVLALSNGAVDAQTRTEIKFWHAMRGARAEAVDELVKHFNQSQVEFEVKAIFKGTYPEVMPATIAAYRKKKDPPHIVQIFDVGTQSMLASSAIVPIHRLMQQQNIAINWADFIETITGYYSKDGKLYSMPFDLATAILFYNKDVFKKAELDDKPPVTWQELETVSRKILASGAAKCGFTTGGSPSWDLLENIFPWHDQPFATNQNGYTGLDTRLLINNDFGLKHVGALAEWHKENIFSYGGYEGEAEQFVNGDCAMLVAESGKIGTFKKSLKFGWGVGLLPHWGPPYPKANTMLGGATLWVLRGHATADYKGVALFMTFLAEPRQQMWWAATTGCLPVTKTALDNMKESGFYKQNPEQWTAMSQLLNATPTPNSRGLRLGNYPQVRDTIELELQEIFDGKKTVKEGLDAAVARGNAILRQFRITHEAAAQGEI